MSLYGPPVSVPGAQSRKNDAIAPKSLNSLDTNLELQIRALKNCPGHRLLNISWGNHAKEKKVIFKQNTLLFYNVFA